MMKRSRQTCRPMRYGYIGRMKNRRILVVPDVRGRGCTIIGTALAFDAEGGAYVRRERMALGTEAARHVHEGLRRVLEYLDGLPKAE